MIKVHLENANLRVKETRHDRQLNSFDILIASSTAKMVASVVTYPHEVVRTRMQTDTHRSSSSSTGMKVSAKKAKYGGIIQSSKTILREEGFSGFYKGLATNLIRTVPAAAVSLLLYEVIVVELNWLLEQS
jgi:solute carrier family 25 folate transporter 32